MPIPSDWTLVCEVPSVKTDMEKFQMPRCAMAYCAAVGKPHADDQS
jgi:hypothetical protein